MFPLQRRGELVFGEPDKTLDNYLILDNDLDSSMESNATISFSIRSNNNEQLGQTQIGLTQAAAERSRNDQYCDNNNNNTRVMHRDIERKRRLQMSNLYASLLSLLPLQHNKGKRSICDHMQEAVSYIKHKEKKIQELRMRRDKLKNKLSSLSSATTKPSCSGGSDHDLPQPHSMITVNRFQDGLEILISTSTKDCKSGFSRVLAELMKRELNVVSCVSTQTNGKFLHKIQAEASDMTSLDLSLLQEGLANATN